METVQYLEMIERLEGQSVSEIFTKVLEEMGQVRMVRRLLHVSLVRTEAGAILSANISISGPMAVPYAKKVVDCDEYQPSTKYRFDQAEASAKLFLAKYVSTPQLA